MRVPNCYFPNLLTHLIIFRMGLPLTQGPAEFEEIAMQRLNGNNDSASASCVTLRSETSCPSPLPPPPKEEV